MELSDPTPVSPRPPLSLVGHDRSRPVGPPADTAGAGAGDICVFFEPSGTVVRLYGRVDATMRKELLEAAFDVVDRGAPVTIEVTPDADVSPGALVYLQRVCHVGQRVAGQDWTIGVPRPRRYDGAPVQGARRPPGRRSPLAR